MPVLPETIAVGDAISVLTIPTNGADKYEQRGVVTQVLPQGVQITKHGFVLFHVQGAGRSFEQLK